MKRELTDSEIFALLSDRHRRLLLRVLGESDEPLVLAELATRIAERAFEQPSEAEQHDVYIHLYHNHIPRFEEADAVVYQEGTVAPDRTFDTCIRVLEKVNDGG